MLVFHVKELILEINFHVDKPRFHQYIFTKKTLDQEKLTGINFPEHKHVR
jgi:hypothetical protein